MNQCIFKLKIKTHPFRGAFPDFSTYELWYPPFSGLAAPVEELKPPGQSDLGFVFLLVKGAVASNAALRFPGPQFPYRCTSRLSPQTRPALRQRDSLWQKLGAARIAAQASGCRLGGTVTPFRRLSSRPGGCRLRSRLQTWLKSVGARPPPRPGPRAPPPQPAALRHRGRSSALRLPAPSARLPCAPARSLPPAGSALTPPHAAAAAGRWRGTTAARCWTKSSPLSSSTISPTRRYRPLGAAGPGPGVLRCRGCRCSRGGWEGAVGALRGSGVPGCRAPLPCTLRYARSEERGAGGPPAQAGALWAPLPLRRV